MCRRIVEGGLQAPELNLNGSGKRDLFEQYRSAIEALVLTGNTLRSSMPHGRDYQTLPDGAYERARAQHLRRLESICKVQDELSAIAADVTCQIKGW